jgi:N-methylhydantoinase A
MACNSERLNLDQINAIYDELEEQARAELGEEGFEPSQIKIHRYADAKYPSQVHDLSVPVPTTGKLRTKDMAQVLEAFHQLHERMFTYCVRESPVDFFHWGVSGIGRTPEVATEEMPLLRKPVAPALKARRKVFFERAFAPTQCYDGAQLLHGMRIEGPAVVEQENTTVVLFAGQKLEVNRFGDFVIAL